MTEQSVTLQPSESKVVSFEATPTKARTYQVSVNGLTGSFVATEVRYLVPCVYCRGTFATEEQLIGHMESKHRGKPYLVSAYLPQAYVEQSRPARHSTAPFSAKGYVPNNRYYQFLTYISSDAYAGGVRIQGKPAGFYEVGASIRSYGVVPYTGYVYLGLGTYAIKTHCVLIVDSALYWLWKGADTGLTIEVVEAPPPAPNVFISQVFVSPTTVGVGKPVKITVVVANTGEATGSLRVTTTINGVTIDTRTVTRTPGRWAGYFLYYTPGTAGTYQVKADGKAASFTAS